LAARRGHEQPHRGDLASDRIYHHAETFQGQSSKQWRYIRRPEDDLRGAAPIAKFEERLSDVICAARFVGQGDLFAIQFPSASLRAVEPGRTLKIAPVSIRNSISTAHRRGWRGLEIFTFVNVIPIPRRDSLCA
jgi:hypothetical protein